MTKTYNMVILILTTYFITGLCNDNKEETSPDIEYMQIFRNIPTLFEYFLDVLQRRVEILESDDISVFQEKVRGYSSNEKCSDKEFKREIDQSLITKSVDNKETVGVITDHKDINYYKSNKNRKLNIKEIYERKRASEHANVKKKTFDASKEPDNVITKPESVKKKFVEKPFNEHLTYRQNYNVRNIAKLSSESKKGHSNLEKQFVGINWGLFYLSPEEVEERAIRTEQMIEDYHKKNRNK